MGEDDPLPNHDHSMWHISTADSAMSGITTCREDESHSFRSPQKVSRLSSQVGLLAWREAWTTAEPFRLPRHSTEWHFLKRQPSLTVAGPRRFCTGLPFYASIGRLRSISMHEPKGGLQAVAAVLWGAYPIWGSGLSANAPFWRSGSDRSRAGPRQCSCRVDNPSCRANVL